MTFDFNGHRRGQMITEFLLGALRLRMDLVLRGIAKPSRR